MRSRFPGALALTFSALSLLNAAARADVLITEVIPNVTTTPTRGDVVELYNSGPSAVDLTDWVLSDLDPDPVGGVLQDVTFAPGSLSVDPLGVGEFAVIEFVDAAGTASWQATNYGLRIVAPLDAGSFLGSERDELLLADAAHTPVDLVVWADTGTPVTADSFEDLSAVTGAVFDYGLVPGDAEWNGPENVASDADYYAAAVDFTAFSAVSSFGGGAIRRRSTGGVFDVAAPDGAAQWEAVARHQATLGNPSDDVPSGAGLRPIRITDDLASWLGQIETTTFPDRRVARFEDQDPPDFVAADVMERTDWQAVVALAMAAAWEEAFAAADAMGYEVVEFLDTVSGETFHILRERFVPGEPGFMGRGTFAFFQGGGVHENLVIEIPHPVNDGDTLEQGAQALVYVRPRVLAIAGTHRNNHLDETTCDGNFDGGAKYRISDVAHHPDNFFHAAHLWLHANLDDMRTVQFHGFCCPGVGTYAAVTDDCILSNGFEALPGPADFGQIWRARIDAQNFLADGVDLTTAAVFGDDASVLGGTHNLQGRISNGVPPGMECNTPALSAAGRFHHLEQDPDVREEPQHILTALVEALGQDDDLPSPCAETPEIGCREAGPGKSKVSIEDKAGGERDRFKWRWSKGEATEVTDFSDAVAGSSVYQVCVYDASVASQPLLDAGVTAAGTCDGRPCWKSLGTKGYGYKDKAATSDGVSSLKLQAGVAGKSQAQVKIGGANMTFAALPLVPPVVVQLLIDDGDAVECWQTTFADPPLKNDSAKFRAKQ